MTDPKQNERLVLPILLTAILISLLAAGCETTEQWYRSEPEVATTAPPKVPASFLFTDFEPLADWFEERFRVEYRNMTPKLVFEQLPINDIHYETENLPPATNLFELKSRNISRREVLYQIAQHWGLTMTIVEEDDLPQRVRVVGQGDQITNQVNFPEEPESDIPGGVGY